MIAAFLVVGTSLATEPDWRVCIFKDPSDRTYLDMNSAASKGDVRTINYVHTNKPMPIGNFGNVDYAEGRIEMACSAGQYRYLELAFFLNGQPVNDKRVTSRWLKVRDANTNSLHGFLCEKNSDIACAGHEAPPSPSYSQKSE